MLKSSEKHWESFLEIGVFTPSCMISHFTLLTDHRPLTIILSPSKSIHSMAAARLQRWALLLAAHNYTIKYRPAADHGNADGLSRLPLHEQHKDKQGTIDTFLINHLKCLPMCCADVKWETRSDCTLSQVMEMVSTARFPTTKISDSRLSLYLVRRNELTLLQGCVMRGNIVIIPPKLRQQVLEELQT